MKNRSQFTHPRPLFALLAAAVLLVAFLPATAFAQSSEKLTRYLPAGTQMIVGFNVSRVKKSKYYKEMMAWLRSEAGSDMKELEDAGLDPSKDIDSLVVAINDPNASNDEFTMALSGTFDSDKLIEAIKKESKVKESTKGKTKVYSNANLDMVFPAKGVIWVTSGSDAYRNAAFSALGSKKKSVSANKIFKGLMGDVDTTKGFWMVGDTSSMPARGNVGSAQPKSIGLSADINSGLALNAFADLPTKDDAKKAVEQVEALKKDRSQTAMLAMFGAGSLVTNLKTKQDGTKIRLSTSMTTAEFDTLIAQVKAMAKSQAPSSNSMPSQPVPTK